MESGQLMIDILVYVSCKFEMYIFKIAKDISENVRIAFLYVLSIYGYIRPRLLSTFFLHASITEAVLSAQNEITNVRS